MCAAERIPGITDTGTPVDSKRISSTEGHLYLPEIEASRPGIEAFGGRSLEDPAIAPRKLQKAEPFRRKYCLCISPENRLVRFFRFIRDLIRRQP